MAAVINLRLQYYFKVGHGTTKKISTRILLVCDNNTILTKVALVFVMQAENGTITDLVERLRSEEKSLAVPNESAP